MNKIASELLKGAVGMLPVVARMVSPALVKKAVGAFLEVIEDGCRKSENKIDDAIVLPICSNIRLAMNVPDEDGDNVLGE